MRDKKVLTIHDLEDLSYAAEYVVSTAQFNFWEFDEDGNHLWELPPEERTALQEEWYRGMKHHPLCFKYSEELRQISFADAIELTLDEVKKKYLKDHLKKLRSILRYDTGDMNGVVVSDEVTDNYLDTLLALRWRECLKFWAMQWKVSGKTQNEEKGS